MAFGASVNPFTKTTARVKIIDVRVKGEFFNISIIIISPKNITQLSIIMIYSKKNHNFVKFILIVVAIIFCFECFSIFIQFSPSNAASSFTVDSTLETLTEGGKTYYLVSNAGELAYATKNTESKNFRVINNIDICSGCMIGAGAVVVNDITSSGTYVGVPAEKQ